MAGLNVTPDDETKDAPETTTTEADTEKRGNIGDELRPYCPTHVCLMTAGGSGNKTTHYSCPVPGCKETQKVARPTNLPPKKPLRCPICAGDKKRAFCEADASRSTAVMIRMACPKCDWSMDIPRPGANPNRRPDDYATR